MIRSPRDYALLCLTTETLPAPIWAFKGPTFHATLTNDSDGGVTLAVRGSLSKTDWAVDFSPFGPSYYEHPDLGSIHSGFDDTTDECLPEVIRVCEGRLVRLTAHSKGGAEAEVLAAKLAIAGIDVDELVTFGTPRWIAHGNTKADLWFPPRKVDLSYRHYKDIVTQVPWWMNHPVRRQPISVGTDPWWWRWFNWPGMHHIEAYAACVPSALPPSESAP